jgi:SP family arabinose:H+ symporter-like MFS transporter
MYISEFSRAAMRGRTSAAFQLAFAIGLAGSYWVDFFFSKSGNWRAMFIVGCVPALILLVSLLGMPDSPRWYFMKGRESEGETALRLVRRRNEKTDALLLTAFAVGSRPPGPRG